MGKVNFGQTGIDGLNCPVCDAPLRVNLNEVASSATVICPHGHEVALNTDTTELREAVGDLNKTFSDLNKTFKIKL
jgi:hypothetical protein